MTKDEALTLARDWIAERPADRPVSAGKMISIIDRALAQPEQEPVAWLVTGPYELVAFSNLDSAKAFCRGLNKGFGEEAYSIKMLYTSPPQRPWVGLTDEDIENCMCMSIQKTCRAIEAKLKEKNT